MSKTNY